MLTDPFRKALGEVNGISLSVSHLLRFHQPLIALGLALWGGVSAAAPNINIDSAAPQPNYSLTGDPADLTQLTDQTLVDFPPWTKVASVGWSQATPVLMRGHMARAGIAFGQGKALRIHTAKGVFAGVFPPRRIDVYCSIDGETWGHGGALQTTAEDLSDRTNVTLDVPLVSDCTSNIALVLHASGSYLMIDEIEVVRVTTTTLTPSTDKAPKLRAENLVPDSLRRLMVEVESEGTKQVANLISEQNLTESMAWVVSPWGSLSTAELSPAAMAAKSLAVTAPAGWPAQYVIGLLNPSNGERAYTLSVSGQPHVDKWRIAPVLAADGQVVFDPLLPMTGNAISVSPHSLAYVMFRHPVVEQSGNAIVTVASGEAWQRTLTVGIEVLPGLTDTRSRAPDVITWSYLSDAPIWQTSNREQLIRFQRDAGVNVFVVHPDSIPLPGQLSEWVRKEKLLRTELRAYKGVGTVLLYLSLNTRFQAGELSDDSLHSSMNEWLGRLTAVMSSEGYHYEDWALYPVDEPVGDGFALLARIGGWIKARDPQVRLYANPSTVGLMDLLPGGAIYSVLDLVDLWQPLIGTPADRLGPILGRRGSGLWSIYQTGTPPTKTIVPNCYRRLAWEAQHRGASGFGFWSFSDTGGSSAWDDLDGTRADWAAVYEANGSVISSRRWEAFRQGIREYRALADCNVSSRDSTGAASCKVIRRILDTEFGSLTCQQ